MSPKIDPAKVRMIFIISLLCIIAVVACESECPPEYTSFERQACFRVVYHRRYLIFQENAARACKDSMGTLASFDNKGQEDWIINKILNETGQNFPLWIGYVRNEKNLNRFKWMDNSTSIYTNWIYREPNNIYEACVRMNLDGWNDIRCDGKEHGFVCRAPDPRATTTTQMPTTTDEYTSEENIANESYTSPGCPSGYKTYKNETCFKVVREFTVGNLSPFSTALENCRKSSGDLASFDNEAQQNWIVRRFLNDPIIHYRMWIGLKRDKDSPGNWKWIDNNRNSYRNWAPREPNNEGNGYPEDCTELEIKHEDSITPLRIGWNDIPCTVYSVKGYICRAPYVVNKSTKSPEVPDHNIADIIDLMSNVTVDVAEIRNMTIE